MQSISLLFVFATSLLSQAHSEDVLTFQGRALEKNWRFSIPKSTVQKSPLWKADADSPPLSLTEAVKKARKKFADDVRVPKEYRHVDTNVQMIPLIPAAVAPRDAAHWAWKVIYRFEGDPSASSPENKLVILVLMDGTAYCAKYP